MRTGDYIENSPRPQHDQLWREAASCAAGRRSCGRDPAPRGGASTDGTERRSEDLAVSERTNECRDRHDGDPVFGAPWFRLEADDQAFLDLRVIDDELPQALEVITCHLACGLRLDGHVVIDDEVDLDPAREAPV